jgi:hypothetical protein
VVFRRSGKCSIDHGYDFGCSFGLFAGRCAHRTFPTTHISTQVHEQETRLLGIKAGSCISIKWWNQSFLVSRIISDARHWHTLSAHERFLSPLFAESHDNFTRHTRHYTSVLIHFLFELVCHYYRFWRYKPSPPFLQS